MANDLRLAVRRALVTHYRAYAGLTALVPASSIHGEQPSAKPAWPFVQYGSATIIPDRESGLDGARIIVSIHSFARGPGADAACHIAEQVARASEVEGIMTEDGAMLDIYWTGGQTLRDDDDADSWHVTTDLEITAAKG